jgi:hypothetical protein
MHYWDGSHNDVIEYENQSKLQEGKTDFRLRNEDSFDGVPIKLDHLTEKDKGILVDTPLMGEMIAASGNFTDPLSILPHFSNLFYER